MKINDESYIMDFGKHKGTKLCYVPASYLLWLFDQEWFAESYPALNEYIEDNIDHLTEEVEAIRAERDY